MVALADADVGLEAAVASRSSHSARKPTAFWLGSSPEKPAAAAVSGRSNTWNDGDAPVAGSQVTAVLRPCQRAPQRTDTVDRPVPSIFSMTTNDCPTMEGMT